ADDVVLPEPLDRLVVFGRDRIQELGLLVNRPTHLNQRVERGESEEVDLEYAQVLGVVLVHRDDLYRALVPAYLALEDRGHVRNRLVGDRDSCRVNAETFDVAL